MSTILWCIFVGLVSGLAGWVYAHHVIAKECENLGGFYVGKKIYKCVAKEKHTA